MPNNDPDMNRTTAAIRTVPVLLLMFMLPLAAYSQDIIRVSPSAGDMTGRIQDAIDMAASYGGRPVVIELEAADYHISRDSSSHRLYHISNTASEVENPDQTKHIGLWLKGLRNVTVDGRGARLVTHGEMTSFVIDGCENVRIENITVTAADPSVPEMTVVEVNEDGFTAQVNHCSDYVIADGRFSFMGEGWTLSGGIAQLYDPQKDITWRSWSPLENAPEAEEAGPGLVRFRYPGGFPEDLRPGLVFQMRDGIRDEACGLIQYSRNVTLENIHFAFLGNFGIVGQMSEDITMRNLVFAPEEESGRTSAGFADFVQMSGCSGRVLIENSRFCGAHDDPVNIHGTHLAVTGFQSPDAMTVRYMHHQTYGFQAFLAGDVIEFIDPHSLLPAGSGVVAEAVMLNPREIAVRLTGEVPGSVRNMEELVVENVTRTPEVVIRKNHFSRVPTRGVLVSTRRKVVIEDNVFFRMKMSAVLIADDARSWFESGMVRDVTVRGNEFVECGGPVILVAPENDRDEGCVHKNISVRDNVFRLSDRQAVSARSVDGLEVSGNVFISPEPVAGPEWLVRVSGCRNVVVEDNICVPGGVPDVGI